MHKRIFILIILSNTLVSAPYLDTAYTLDLVKSIIQWKSSYTFQFSEHNGSVYFKEGTLYAFNKGITDGDFTIDMTSITTRIIKKE